MLKTIGKLAKMQLKQYWIYPSNFYLFTLNRIVEVMVYIFVWQAIYAQTGGTAGFTLTQMITYYILVTTLRPIATWGINEDIAYSIRKGRIHKELLNPISYFTYYFGVNLGEIAFSLIIGGTIFIICNIFWTVALPISIFQILIFAFVILLGVPVTFFIQMIVGTVGFYTNSIWGMEILRRSTIALFSGMIAPLTLFPEWFRNIADILPFKELIDTPIQIWLGTISINEILFSIVKLAIWGILLYGIAKIFFNHAIKKVTINGG